MSVFESSTTTPTTTTSTPPPLKFWLSCIYQVDVSSGPEERELRRENRGLIEAE